MTREEIIQALIDAGWQIRGWNSRTLTFGDKQMSLG